MGGCQVSYVKLTARPDTWFKAGTEVYDYDCNPPEDVRRITLAAWEEAAKHGWGIDARGIKVADADNPDEMGWMKMKPGEERRY